MRGRDSFRLGPVTRAVWTQDHVDWAETEGAEALGLGWGGAGAGGPSFVFRRGDGECKA